MRISPISQNKGNIYRDFNHTPFFQIYRRELQDIEILIDPIGNYGE
jgi:hypothetical protein